MCTVTSTLPPVARRADETTAVSWVEETKVVGKLTPPHLTTLVELKLAPVAVRLTEAAPAIAEVGLMDDRVGTGFLTLKVRVFEKVAKSELVRTRTACPPCTFINAAETVAVSDVLFTKVDGIVAPSHCTEFSPVNPVPVIVRVRIPLPTSAEEGERPVRTGWAKPNPVNARRTAPNPKKRSMQSLRG